MTGRYLHCPKCGNGLGKTDPKTQGRTCLSCGYQVRGSREVHKMIQINAKEIAHDYLTLGLTETLAKWGITSTPLYRLPEVRALRGKYSRLLTRKGGRTELPPFNNEWDKEVQLKWLELYREIYGKEMANVSA